MKKLREQFLAQNCIVHQIPIERICIEFDCKHSSRCMCYKCPRSETSHLNEVNIHNLFDYLSENQSEQNAYNHKATLFQQFARFKALIIEALDQLQSWLMSQINQLLGTVETQLRERGFLDRVIDQQDVQAMGEFFNSKIQITVNDKLQIKHGDDINEQDQYQMVFQVIESLNIVSDQLRDKLGVLQNISSCINEEHIEYELSQSIQQNSVCQSICLNRNETQIAAAVYKSIILLNLEQGVWIQEETKLFHHKNTIWQILFNNDSTQIVSCSEDKLIIIWNKESDGSWHPGYIIPHNDAVLSIAFNHNSNLLASTSKVGRITLYRIQGQKCNIEQELIYDQRGNNQASQIWKLCFDHTSKILASGGEQSIILWQYSSYQNKWRQKQILKTERTYSMSFNSNSTQLVSSSEDGAIQIWLTDSQANWICIHKWVAHSETATNVLFLQKSNMIATSSWDNSIKIWRINEELNWECSQTIETKDSINATLLSNDSSTIISGLENGQIIIHKHKLMP